MMESNTFWVILVAVFSTFVFAAGGTSVSSIPNFQNFQIGYGCTKWLLFRMSR